MYFFFFKQKTAYEMRISDWSSDVCSSDLDQSPPRHAKFGSPRKNSRTRTGRPSKPDSLKIAVGRKRHVPPARCGLHAFDERLNSPPFRQGRIFRTSLTQADELVKSVVQLRGAVARCFQTGRASCRERRCQDG